MNTNTKEYKGRITAYFESVADFSGYDDLVGLSPMEKAEEVFHSECGWNVLASGLRNAVRDWLQGLPSCLTIAFSDGDILELYRDLHGEACEESKERRIISGYFDHMAHKLTQIWEAGK